MCVQTGVSGYLLTATGCIMSTMLAFGFSWLNDIPLWFNPIDETFCMSLACAHRGGLFACVLLVLALQTHADSFCKSQKVSILTMLQLATYNIAAALISGGESNCDVLCEGKRCDFSKVLAWC